MFRYNVRINDRMVLHGSFLQGLMGVTDYYEKNPVTTYISFSIVKKY